MTTPVDPIIEADLHAYLDDQLSMERRIAVEAHLARHPELAARVMGDMRLRDELRLALASMPLSPRPQTVQAGRRLERALRWRRRSRTLQRLAAVGAFLMAGWFAHAQFGALGIGRVEASDLAPAYIEEAISAYNADNTASKNPRQLEKRLEKNLQPAPYDPRQILAQTAITLPELPDDWRVDEVSVTPSPFGPSVGLRLHGPEIGAALLIAMRPGVFNVLPVTVARHDGDTIAHWQIGDIAYALVATEPAPDITRSAEGLLRTLY